MDYKSDDAHRGKRSHKKAEVDFGVRHKPRNASDC